MKRLRDEDQDTPLIKQAQALLDALPPLEESVERMARVRQEIDRREQSGSMFGQRRVPAWTLVCAMLVFAGSAFAAVRWFQTTRTNEPTPEPATQQARQAPPPKPPEPSVVIEPTTESVTDTAMPETTRTRKATTTATRAPRPAQPETTAPTDSENVHRAVKALRRDHDPTLAVRLLDESRAQNPDGPLAEEALSLQIEALLALHDPRSRTLARQYVSQYPNGRYLKIAQRALQEPTP